MILGFKLRSSCCKARYLLTEPSSPFQDKSLKERQAWVINVATVHSSYFSCVIVTEIPDRNNLRLSRGWGYLAHSFKERMVW